MHGKKSLWHFCLLKTYIFVYIYIYSCMRTLLVLESMFGESRGENNHIWLKLLLWDVKVRKGLFFSAARYIYTQCEITSTSLPGGSFTCVLLFLLAVTSSQARCSWKSQKNKRCTAPHCAFSPLRTQQLISGKHQTSESSSDCWRNILRDDWTSFGDYFFQNSSESVG